MLTRATGLRLRRPRLGQLLIAVSVGVVAVSAVASFAIDRPGTTELAAPSSRESSGSDGILVHVTGAVNSPGVVSLAVGSRVLDAIASAGGLGPNADQSAINLAREVRNGEQLVVPLVGAAGAADTGAALVNINTATASVLESLPHVGPALAARIIEYRAHHGSFQSVDELQRVPGIGAKTFAQLAPLLSV